MLPNFNTHMPGFMPLGSRMELRAWFPFFMFAGNL